MNSERDIREALAAALAHNEVMRLALERAARVLEGEGLQRSAEKALRAAFPDPGE